ncbi:MAG: NAD(P)-dependent oxidoreductase [Prevotellaceae bacterium]|jgi:nucleoside-diphosphate-sugar epimerase|nr:NAD(P)-dependent oxidoreductase [Prevotellaceae bacterium]
MKILITGAAGFIGSFMVEEALSRGFDTYAGVRATSSRQYLTDERIKFVDLKYNDKEALVKQLSGLKDSIGKFDCIVHGMGVTKCRNKGDFERINYGYTKNFVEALTESDSVPDKFVYISSLSAWGPGDSKTGKPIMLSDEPKPDTLYGASKLKAEQFIASIPAFPYIFLRPTGVYGPREKDYFVFNKTVSNGIEPAMGFQTQYLTFIYVRDLVRLALLACRSDIVRKAYFVSDGREYTDKEYSAIVKKHLGRKHTLKLRVPLFLVKSIAYFLDTVCGWFGQTPTLNKDKYKILRVTNWRCETKPTEDDFNFAAVYDLDKGTEEAIKWYKQEKWL